MQRLVAFLFFIFSAAHLAFPARTIAGAANQIQRPPSATSLNLFFTDRLLERMKTRIEQQRWARQIWETRLETARRWVALKMEIPKTGGGYFHDYACPDDGARLEFNPARPRQHLCPTCKRLLTGPQLDAYWVSIVHASNIQTAKALALNARLFGNEADAKWAKDILQYYARHYEEYPVHGNRAGQGRIFFQSLDESVNMLEAAAVFELLLPSELSADEADVVREKLFRPAGALVRKFHRGVHNIQCWHAAFLLTCAIICDDKPLRDEALASVEANLIKGVTPDGWWWEGSPGYHFYTLSALNRLAIPARHNQLTTEHTSRMIEMLMVPFRVAYPDLNLPAVNDTHIPRLASLAPYLEAGIYLFDDQRLGAALSQLYESGKVERSSFEALCYGPDKLARGDQLVQKSERLDHAGMAILRRPRSGLYALLRSGIYQGGHDHPDRLGLIVYGLGQQLAPDLGTCGYGLPLLRWYRSTVAHNTLVIDEHSLDVRKSDATCTFFRDEADFSAAAVRASQIYPGVELTRTVVVLDDALIDFYRAKSEMVEITMDWVWHSVGRLTTSLPEATAQGSGPRYQFLEDVRALKPGSQAEISWQVQGGKVSLTLFDMDKAQLFSARGPGFPGEEKLSLVIARKRAQTGQFVAVFQIVADSKRPKPVGLVEQGPNRIVVQLDNARYELTANTARRF